MNYDVDIFLLQMNLRGFPAINTQITIAPSVDKG